MTDLVAAPNAVPAPRMTGAFLPLDFGLYGAVVLLWGSSWIALHLQLGVVAPEVSLVWRFGIAASVMLAWALLAKQRLRFSLRDHVRFVVLGATMFSANFVLFYYGGLSTPSGLLAVVFSLASVFNMLLSALFFRQRPGARLIVAAILGFLGVVAMFEPVLAPASFTVASLEGLALCIAGTLSFCLGNVVSIGNQRRGIPIASSTVWGMVYGTAVLVAVALARGQAFIIELTLAYVGSVVWSAVFASVFGFAAYMTLLSRIGAARTGYSTVLYPVVALALSTVLEGYVWTLPAMIGLGLVILGNIVMLTSRT
jgi:drug/metabolite transporter (DMT)-like permease